MRQFLVFIMVFVRCMFCMAADVTVKWTPDESFDWTKVTKLDKNVSMTFAFEKNITHSDYYPKFDTYLNLYADYDMFISVADGKVLTKIVIKTKSGTTSSTYCEAYSCSSSPFGAKNNFSFNSSKQEDTWTGYQQKLQIDCRRLDVVSIAVTYADATSSVTPFSFPQVPFSTYYNGASGYFMPTGCTGYTLTVEPNGDLVKTPTYPSCAFVPQGTPLLIHNTGEQKSYPVYTSSNSNTVGMTAPSKNLFGTDAETTVSESGFKYYMLSLNQTTGVVGFFWQNGSNEGTTITNGAHKCYLRVPTVLSQALMARGFSFDDTDDSFTGIVSNDFQRKASGKTYDIRGVQTIPLRGIAVKDGKKFLIE